MASTPEFSPELREAVGELGLEMTVPPISWSARLAAFDSEIFGRDSWPPSVWSEELRRDDRLYIACVEPPDPLRSLPRLAAVVGVRIDEDSELLTISVSPRWRRRRLARGLVREVIAYAQAKGARRMFLEVRAQSLGPQELYRQLGFDVIARRKRYYSDDDALVMAVDFGELERGGERRPERGAETSPERG